MFNFLGVPYQSSLFKGFTGLFKCRTALQLALALTTCSALPACAALAAVGYRSTYVRAGQRGKTPVTWINIHGDLLGNDGTVELKY